MVKRIPVFDFDSLLSCGNDPGRECYRSERHQGLERNLITEYIENPYVFGNKYLL
jgi:hypothetical protein